MAKVFRRHWEGATVRGLPRRDPTGCDYEAYLPDPLMGRSYLLDGAVAADVADAEAAIARLNSEATALVDTEALARLLLRAESVASSRIEGLEIGGRRLLRAEAARALGERSGDITAEEVLGNIESMTWAVENLAAANEVTVDGLLEAHRRLLQGTRLEDHGGQIRNEQNWIGGSSYNPCTAAFVPPPPEFVHSLVKDLCVFSNTDDLPPVTQAAIAHAQFETIHPFVDGNGRTGRALIHVILRRRELAPHVLPPVSLVLATWSRDYIDGLTASRYKKSPTSLEARTGLNQWIGLFAAACRRSVEDALDFENRIEGVQARWRSRLGRIRAGSAVALLMKKLPGAPVITVNTAADLIERSYQQTNEAIRRLEDADILTMTTVGRRNRAFEARAILDAFNDLERRLASPEGNTRASSPSRRVPAGRKR
jgi:Fic family protein